MSNFACPIDGSVLVPIERQGIEIDHCPSCRGVWLDRGELDKILERSAAPTQAYRPDRSHHDDHRGHAPKKRKSFLSELFD